jgi:FkbM family methyltransferase
MIRQLGRTGKRALKALLGQDLFLHTEANVRKCRFGSTYGGWDVALEGVGPDTVVYSAGVGEDASFDMALIEHFKLVVHAFDPTPKSIDWVHHQRFPANFIFHAYGLADYDGQAAFNPPENPDHVSHTMLERLSTAEKAINVPVKKLKTIMTELRHGRIDILKMDIEGAELQVLRDLLNSEIRPTQILVEFHHRFPNVGVRKTKESIQDLRKGGYRLFSVSESGEDLCFIYNPE